MNTYYPPIALRSNKKHTFKAKFTSSAFWHEKPRARGNGMTTKKNYIFFIRHTQTVLSIPLPDVMKISKVMSKLTCIRSTEINRINKKGNYLALYTVEICGICVGACPMQVNPWVMRRCTCCSSILTASKICF